MLLLDIYIHSLNVLFLITVLFCLICPYHLKLSIVFSVCGRTAQCPKRNLSINPNAGDHPTFALVNPALKTGKGLPGTHVCIGTSCLMSQFILFDGEANFIETFNKKFKTQLTLENIRSTAGFNKNQKIYAMVMFGVKFQTPRPIECKLRLGWGIGSIPIPSKKIDIAQSLIKSAKRQREDDTDPLATSAVDPEPKTEPETPQASKPEHLLKSARHETHETDGNGTLVCRVLGCLSDRLSVWG